MFDPIIKGKSSVSVNEDGSVNINRFTVSDDDNPASLKIKMNVDHGDLTLATTTGIAGSTSGDSIEFSGSIADLNTALNSLSYHGNTDYSGTDDITIQVSDDDGATWHGYQVDEIGKFYNSLNKHYYEFVNAPGITWTDAKATAEAKTLYGLKGYLTTITSAAENSFIAPKLGGAGWMGASDAKDEGQWLWVTGPEAGTQFWSGNENGRPVNSMYNNWLPRGEPNDSGSRGEDYAQFRVDDKGTWNDLRFDKTTSITGYVIEYGGDGTGTDGFGTLQAVPLEITINSVNDAPVINNIDGDSVSTTVNQVAFLDSGTANNTTDVDATDLDGGTLVITTTFGTADGNFSLDGANATADGNSAIMANDTIAVGGTNIGTVDATNDGQGGNTLTITLNGSATLSNVAQLIKNIGYASATAGTRDFNLALSENDGTTGNAALSVQVLSGNITYENTTLNESSINNGAISTTLSISLTGDTFTGTNGEALGTVTNFPIGLTPVLVKTSDTTATLSLTGNATAHANTNDINNLTVTFADADFTSGSTANIANALKSDLIINFFDPQLFRGDNNSSTSSIDGVVVNTSTTTNGNSTTSTTTVPVITTVRKEDTSTEHQTFADIPLVTNDNDQTLLQVSLPVGVGLTSKSITSDDDSTLREKLITASHPKVTETQVFDEIVLEGIDAYVKSVQDENQVTLRTITLDMTGDQAPSQPVIITGAFGTGEDSLENPLRQEALVIDTRDALPGTELQFDNVEFAIIIGGGRVLGGEGRNFVVGDDADQFVVLGAEDDILRGGFGDDTIGSQGGDDQLFGDEGNDHLIGGQGSDMLVGSDGNDLLQGGQSDAGAWTFSLNDQNQVISTFSVEDTALYSASNLFTQPTNWFSGSTPITNDERVSFVYHDSARLETIATLYQSVLQRLPTTNEIYFWAQQELTQLELGETAYQTYLELNGNAQTETLKTQVIQLINQVWGNEHATSDWIDLGVDYFNNGGSWNKAILFMANHNNLKNTILDNNNHLKLTQNLVTSETGWSSDTGNDILRGGQGNDTLIGGRGHNLLDGGTGIDSAKMVGTADIHHVYINNDGKISIHRSDDRAVNDLVDIEKVIFSDQTLNVSASNLNAETLKDFAALIHLVDNTSPTLTRLNQLAESNITTSEFAKEIISTTAYEQNWGSLSNTDFIVGVSNAVLETPLTGDSLAFWVNQLEQDIMSQDEILLVAANVTNYQNTLFAGDGMLVL